MAVSNDIQTLLDQINEPAFLVQESTVITANSEALKHFVQPGASVEEFITVGADEYRDYKGGNLFLSLQISGTDYPCSVTELQSFQLFVLETAEKRDDLQILSLAAAMLNQPLSELSLAIDRLSDGTSAEKSRCTHSLLRLQRIVGNMADAYAQSRITPKLYTVDICAAIAETLQKVKHILEQVGHSITFTLPSQPIYMLADTDILNRSIYNLISNAVKFSPVGSSIEVSLQKHTDRLYLSVTNTAVKALLPKQNIFNRYSRHPALEDPKYGLGLGMSFVRSAANAHGGTVLMEQSEDFGIRLTMTLRIQKSKDGTFRSPIIRPDIYGGRDQALIELSDILPHSFYESL